MPWSIKSNNYDNLCNHNQDLHHNHVTFPVIIKNKNKINLFAVHNNNTKVPNKQTNSY